MGFYIVEKKHGTGTVVDYIEFHHRDHAVAFFRSNLGCTGYRILNNGIAVELQGIY